MFAPLHYLCKLKQYYDIQNKLVIQQVTDSDSLIQQINNSKDNLPISARVYMKSEIDLEMQILDTIKKLDPLSYKLYHVKGHQDQTKKIEDLTWEKR